MKKYCQSCGYPMSKDEKGGGTNADGTLNDTYCSLCYENGVFTSPIEINTVEKFQQYCIEQMKKKGMNGLLAWLLTRGMARLGRWKNK